MPCQPPETYSDPRDLGQVFAPLRDRLWTATLHAPRHGLVLVSGKRTDYMQWLLRHERVPGHECDPAYPAHPTTALPGRSNHRNISAKISAADMGGIDLDWLGSHQADFGLHRPVRGEKWHFEVAGPSKVTIVPYGTHGGDTPTDPNVGHHWVGFRPGDVDGVRGSIYKRGGLDNEIAEVQIRLKIRAKVTGDAGFDPGAIDGIYGPKLQAATLHFHHWVRSIQKATGQKMWPPADAVWGPKKVAMLRWWTA